MPKDPRLKATPRTANQALLDRILRHTVFLERLKSHEVNALIADLNSGAFEKFVERLRKALDRVVSRGRRTLELQKVADALAQSRDLIGKGYSKLADALTTRLSEVAKMEAAWQVKTFREVTPGLRLDFTSPNLQTLRRLAVSVSVAGTPLRKEIRKMGVRTTERVERQVRLGLTEGQSVDDIVRRVRGTRAAGFSDGVLNASRHEVETLVRTTVNHAVTQAREQTFEENDDLVKGVQYRATLDLRTTETCFTGTTPVALIGDFHKIFRSEYVGEIITIRTARGKKLEGTPNHPVLTSDGFLPLGELQPRKQVIYAMSAECVETVGHQNVGVPATFAQLFDALHKPAISRVQLKRAAPADFYGDGVGMHGQINIAISKRHLRSHVKTSSGERPVNQEFRSVHASAGFSPNGGCLDLLLRRAPVCKAAQPQLRSFQDCPDPLGTALRDKPRNFGRARSGLVQLNRSMAVVEQVRVTLATLQGWHDSVALQQRSDRAGRRVEAPTDRSSRFPAAVCEDHVVSVVREFRRCHVYTLQTSLGIYAAGGLIVKNCISLDGEVFPIDEGPRPPQHPNCRSTIVPVLKSWKELGIDLKQAPEGTRASMDGQVPASLTYFDWLKDQSTDRQNEVLGVEKAKLFRQGKITDQRHLVDQRGRPLSLDELKSLEGIED